MLQIALNLDICNLRMEEDLARAYGLWWAEGDSKTIREITFTNNCFELVKFFYKIIEEFAGRENFRLYVYRPSKDRLIKIWKGAELNIMRMTEPLKHIMC